jgi:hypothetical protein
MSPAVVIYYANRLAPEQAAQLGTRRRDASQSHEPLCLRRKPAEFGVRVAVENDARERLPAYSLSRCEHLDVFGFIYFLNLDFQIRFLKSGENLAFHAASMSPEQGEDLLPKGASGR